MSIKNILFDLDGTLLPMDQEVFVRAYTKRLAAYMAPYGYDPEGLIRGLWAGTGAMVKNDGRFTNEAVFWKVFSSFVGKEAREDEAVFERFYQTDFQNVKAACGFTPKAGGTVKARRTVITGRSGLITWCQGGDKMKINHIYVTRDTEKRLENLISAHRRCLRILNARGR